LGAVTESSAAEPSASELNRQLTNPVSNIWSISNQFTPVIPKLIKGVLFQ
jgi:hypothetical protein